MDLSPLLLIICVLFAVVVSGGLYSALSAQMARLRAHALTQRGVPVEATITSLEERALPRGLYAHVIHYSYGVPESRGARIYGGREVVTPDEYRRYRVGDKLWVHYLPDHPEMARRTDALARLPGRKQG